MTHRNPWAVLSSKQVQANKHWKPAVRSALAKTAQLTDVILHPFKVFFYPCPFTDSRALFVVRSLFYSSSVLFSPTREQEYLTH